MKRFEVGARVVEPTYGLGSVIAVEDAYTRVQFDEHGVKKFMTSMSKLEPSTSTAPEGWRWPCAHCASPGATQTVQCG